MSCEVTQVSNMNDDNEWYAVNQLALQLEEAEQQRLYDYASVDHIDDATFVKFFRLDKGAVLELEESLFPFLPVQQRDCKMSRRTKVN